MTVFFLFLAQPFSAALARDRVFSREVTPVRSGVFDPKDEEVVALAKARQSLLAEMGSWLASFSEVKSKISDKEGLSALAAALVRIHAKGSNDGPGGGVSRIVLSASVSDGEARKGVGPLIADPAVLMRYKKAGMRESQLMDKVQDIEKRLSEARAGGRDYAASGLAARYGELAVKLAAVSLMYMAHDEYFKGGKSADLDKAMKYYQGAARLDGGYADAWNCQALVHLSKTEYPEAIEDFTRAISLSPKDPDLFQDRGVTFGQVGRPDLAVKDFTVAITLKPDFTRAYAARAYAYTLLNRMDEACKDLHKACDLGECMFLKGAQAVGKCK